MSASLNILFLAAEAEPFVKVGGLADVAGSLPLALRTLPYQAASGASLDIRLVLPYHSSIQINPSTLHDLGEFPVHRNGGWIPAKVIETSLDGMPVYFINGEPISNNPGVYSPDPAIDREKYAFFSLAVLELINHVGWKPNIIHANDWHTALTLYALHLRQSETLPERIRTVLTVHNLPYMGGDSSEILSSYGLPPLYEDSMPKWANTQPLPLGLWAADAIVTVSPTYAREIITPDFGCGLDPYLFSHADRLTGILNGFDAKSWDPGTDKNLTSCFTSERLFARAENKKALQKSLGLPEDERVPVLAMVGRVDWQKGLDITFKALRQMTVRNWQFVILGSGDPALENMANNLQVDFPDQIRAVIRYDAPLSHQIYAGADMLLMPSRYEPCGIAQMIAMHYGCIPIVRATGGLKDTVQEGRTGFLFKEAEPESLLVALELALAVYSDVGQWQQIQGNGMQEDFSWFRSAKKYAQIYNYLISDS